MPCRVERHAVRLRTSAARHSIRLPGPETSNRPIPKHQAADFNPGAKHPRRLPITPPESSRRNWLRGPIHRARRASKGDGVACLYAERGAAGRLAISNARQGIRHLRREIDGPNQISVGTRHHAPSSCRQARDGSLRVVRAGWIRGRSTACRVSDRSWKGRTPQGHSRREAASGRSLSRATTTQVIGTGREIAGGTSPAGDAARAFGWAGVRPNAHHGI